MITMYNDYLYHYTTMDNAIKIIASNTLLFGKLENMNDINESYRSVFGTENAIKEVYNLLQYYQQISFVADKFPRRGYAIPSMWGHYAEHGFGVCMVFDKKKLFECLSPMMLSSDVNYTSEYDSSIIIKDNVEDFISQNIQKLFFTKTDDWANEQEFRVIVKTTDLNRVKLNLQNSLYANILYFAIDVQKDYTVYDSLNVKILSRLNANIPIFELGYWEGKANLRDCNGKEIYL